MNLLVTFTFFILLKIEFLAIQCQIMSPPTLKVEIQAIIISITSLTMEFSWQRTHIALEWNFGMIFSTNINISGIPHLIFIWLKINRSLNLKIKKQKALNKVRLININYIKYLKCFDSRNIQQVRNLCKVCI